MAVEFFAVEGMSLKFVNPAHSGDITLVEIPNINPSSKATAGGKKIYLDLLAVSITNGSNGVISNTKGAGVMLATSEKHLLTNLRPLRNGDQSSIITMQTDPPPPILSYTTQIEIDDPNQDKWSDK